MDPEAMNQKRERNAGLIGEPRSREHAEYLSSVEPATGDQKSDLPNIVYIMMDDMGWGDMSGYGSKAIDTPHLDQLAADGVAFTNGYSSSPVCTPSRFGFLTGRYPSRGVITNVFFPTVDVPGDQCFDMGYDDDKVIAGEDASDSPRRHPKQIYDFINSGLAVKGILPDEITVAEALQARGYRTGMFGKWHLGDQHPSLPNDKGFDYFYGAYYSNDMCPYHFYRNEEIAVEGVIDQTKITRMLTDEILDFIDTNAGEPFFLYYPSPKPHHPLYAGKEFQGTSKAGTYGDCIQEVDWSVGQIVAKLREKGIAEKTMIVFTSDNGPWHQGSPGLHRGRKGNNFDGGQVVPMLVSWPGTIPAGRSVTEQMMNIDFFPTFLGMAGVPLPSDRAIDGRNLMPLLTGETDAGPHDELFFVMDMEAYGLRHRDHFKYFATTTSENAKYLGMGNLHPFLFNLEVDPDESYDLRDHYPQRAQEMRDRLYEFNRELETNPRGWV